MYESALIYRTNLSALFSKEFLCASQALLQLCISFLSAVPGRVLVESELRQEVFFPSRVRLSVPPCSYLHHGGTDLCVFAVCHVTHVAKFISNWHPACKYDFTCRLQCMSINQPWFGPYYDLYSEQALRGTHICELSTRSYLLRPFPPPSPT